MSISPRHFGRRVPTSPCVLLAALLTTTLTACAATPRSSQPSAPPDRRPTASAAVLEQIKAEIGTASCDSDVQCHTLAVGAKACGGPEAYLPWSSKTSNPARLKTLSEQQALARREENAREGGVSNCMYLMDPGAVCQAGHCKPGNGGLSR